MPYSFILRHTVKPTIVKLLFKCSVSQRTCGKMSFMQNAGCNFVVKALSLCLQNEQGFIKILTSSLEDPCLHLPFPFAHILKWKEKGQ